MIKCKILGFYRVALSSVEVALKLRAVGSIAPFFSGKDDGKWGLLIIIAVIFGILLLITLFK